VKEKGGRMVLADTKRDGDMEIIATIESKVGKRSQDGNPYFEYVLIEDGATFSVTHRQFEGLEKDTVSGNLSRSAQKGEKYKFLTFTREAPRGNYHNIRQVLAKIEAGSVAAEDSDFDQMPDEVTVDPVIETAGDASHDSDFDGPTVSPAVSASPEVVSHVQRNAERYIPGNQMNSVSIERQVSAKAGVDLIGYRVRVFEALLSSGQLVGTDRDPYGVDILNMYWGWITSNDSLKGLSQQVATWIEFGQ
jgi:hypothetical protein